MDARLNIYKDCSSDEPTKVYICKRLILGVSKKVQSLSNSMNGKNEQEQEEITIKILKTIFPTFEDDEFNYIDPIEYMQFVNEIARETNQVLANAQKN